MKTKIIALGAVLSAVLLSAFLLSGCSENKTEDKLAATDNAVTYNKEGLVKIPINTITGKLKKFDYDASGIKVTYFAILGSDSKVRTAFDACDVCGGKKGYRQTGANITCNNCGRVFSIDGLGTKNKGYGCWPSYLPHEIKDGQMVIKTADLEAGAFRFV
ncbi:MAG: DUF2318 domain-containing protein [Nanoarchaeota archaeon]